MRRDEAVPAARATGSCVPWGSWTGAASRPKRQRASRFAGLCALVPLVLASALAQDTPAPAEVAAPRVTPIQIPNLPLGVVTFPNGKAINLTLAMGSAAFRAQGDALGRVWLLTDRGPSIGCEDAKRVIGLEPDQLCAGDKAGRIYPLPGFVPSIYGVDIGIDNIARINVYLPLKGRSGKPVSGRPGPASAPAKAEATFGTDGKPLAPDPSGIDPEGFVRLQDGSFWLADEFGPSLIEVAPDGAILRRLVPANAAADFKDADYEVVPALPSGLRLRLPGRGLEGLAISPDERFLYTAMQSPLANPDVEASRVSRNLRIWKFERASGRLVGSYFYELDEPAAFRADAETRERQQSEVGVTEIVGLAEDRLLMVERLEKTTRMFVVQLEEGSLIPPALDLPETRPTLEQLTREAARERGVQPLAKQLVLDSDLIPGLPAKVEAVAVLAPDEILLLNDNDFAVDGARTQMFRVILPNPLLR